MKKSDPIIVPKGIEYIGDWEGYDLEDYPFPHILNKVLTGCGYTEYCLRSNQPLALISPRVFLLENKWDQHQNPFEVFYVNNEVEKSVDFEIDITEEKEQKNKTEKFSDETKREKIEKLIHEIRQYVITCRIKNITPKILVTYDSFRHVKEALKGIGVLENFQFVVDEFQSIFIDSRFKSDTEIELLHHLQDLKRVCFVSATPMLDKYLDMLPEFKDLPYYEFDWVTEEPERTTKPKLEIKFTTRTLNEEVKRIIKSYKDGKFESVLGESGLIESKEAVLFLNSVNGICQAIRSSKLHLDQCNILCAKTDDNDKKIRKAFNDVLTKEAKEAGITPTLFKKEDKVIGKIPKEGEQHKMFTFCTRTVYLGADFYSTNARTFIFSNSNIDCLSVDISMDLEQILGRQRLKENPWKNCAWMCVKTTSKLHKTTKEEFDKRLEEKKQNSISLLSSYEKSNSTEQYYLAKKYQRDAKTSHYKYDYVAVNEHAGNTLVPVLNNLMMVSEMRTFEVQQTDYADRFSVINTMNEKGIDGIIKKVYDEAEQFNNLKTSVDKLKKIVELSEKLGEKDMNDFLSLINPSKYREYFKKMGPERIKANSYQESKLKAEWNKQHQEELGVSGELVQKIIDHFKLGHRFSRTGIKEKLKEMYQESGYDKTAKASDIKEYLWTKDVKFLEDGKWVNGYEITGKK